jgi:alpha-beta hydrolase superfamily lysophospholipase
VSALRSFDGLRLHLQHWPANGASEAPADAPDHAPLGGTVLIVHGLGEHIGRYAHVAEHLQRSGWAVSGYDQRGHGRSEGPRGGLARDDALLTDLASVIDALPARPPLVLLGHSLGGLLAARFVAGGVDRSAPWFRPVQALVLSSPALDPGLGAVQKLLLVLGRLMPDQAVGNGLKPEWISRDPLVVEAYRSDPLVHDRVVPRLARFIVDAGREVRANAARWPVPTLLLYAGADRCVASAGSADFAGAAPKPIVTAHRFAPLFHEIFNEPEQREVLAMLSAWLDGVDAAPGHEPSYTDARLRKESHR